MINLLKLFSLLQLSKEQPVSGYIIGGLKREEVPSLAEHHYTTALIAYFLTHRINSSGGSIHGSKVVIMCLIHDLSELFGGDISGPLNRKYPDLRDYKDKIGERAIDVLCEYMDGASRDDFRALWDEMNAYSTDEAIVSKIIDQMEHQFFLEHHNFKSKYDPGAYDYRPEFIKEHVIPLCEKLEDSVTKEVMSAFIHEFNEHYFNKGFQSMKILME